jgi:type I restriction enzyme M protein
LDHIRFDADLAERDVKARGIPGYHPFGRWRAYDYDELIARDKASLNISWLRDDSLADSDNLPLPDVIAQEIVDDLEAALEQFRLIAGDLNNTSSDTAA